VGGALRRQGKWAAATASFRRALRVQPDNSAAYRNLGYLSYEQARFDEAIEHLEHAIRVQPADADAHFSLSTIYLRLGDFRRGWAEHEWRFEAWPETARGPQPSQPRWDGAPLKGRRILLRAEFGLGDTLQFIRYAALVRRRGGRVLVACQGQLLPILKTCPGIDGAVALEGPLPDCDVHAPFLSLPHIFGTTLDTVPADVPYLAADAKLVERWRRELGASRDFKIGIAWQGNPDHLADRERSVSLTQFAPLARVPGVRMFSLQKGAGSEQLRTAAFPVVDLGSRLDEDTGPFLDTAAVMANLDLIVAVDTAVAHLAGALGVPVWVPLHFVGDWRWLEEREDTPWYPSMRLFRMEAPNTWEPVFRRLARAARKLVAH
jgi:hypothetical protein